jgi:AraC-like DNA-binding protein
MAKLVNLIPGREVNSKPTIKEELDDMDVSLPSQLDRYLDKTIGIIKRYNLSRAKEQYVIAKLIDALGMNPSQLASAVARLKRFKIVRK